MTKFKIGDLCRGRFEGNSILEATICLTEMAIPNIYYREFTTAFWTGEIVCVHFSNRNVTEKLAAFYEEQLTLVQDPVDILKEML